MPRLFSTCVLLWLLPAPLFADEPRPTTLDNGLVRATWNPTTESFSVEQAGCTFIRQGTFGDVLPKGPFVLREEKGDQGQSLSIIHPRSGRRAQLIALKGFPFLFIKFFLRAREDELLEVRDVTAFSAPLELAKPKQLCTLGYDGLAAAEAAKKTYLSLAVAEPSTRAGVVCGWLSHDRGSGIVATEARGERVHVEAQCQYGLLRIAGGDTVAGETLAVGYFSDVRDGLERYAEAMAALYQIKVRPAIAGYMTWYHAKALDQRRLAELAAWCKTHLEPYGLSFLQIDDGWQLARRDFTAHDPNGPYPQGMKAAAAAIARQGLTAGLWLTPFAWDHTRPSFADRSEWFVKRPGGEVYSVDWAGDCLDMTHPDARQFLEEQLRRMSTEWAFRIFKLDGLWAGLCAKILYPQPQYRPDGFGDALFFDLEATNIDAFRTGLKAARRAVGPEAFLLGCTAAQNMRTLGGSIGLVDAMRVGIDSQRKWSGIVENVKVSTSLYYLHGRVWRNDPDVVYLDRSFSLDQVRTWASWVAITGQMYMLSDPLPDVPAERIEIVRRTLAGHALRPRPVDLLDTFPARVWLLSDEGQPCPRQVLAAFNWGDRPTSVAIDRKRLGLPAGTYRGYDFWNDAPLAIGDRIALDLPPGGCRIVALRRDEDRPLVLSTSRHVTQGIIDLQDEHWDAASRELSGRSAVVAGDRYTLRVAVPAGLAWSPAARVSDEDAAAGVRITGPTDGGLGVVRVTIDSPASRSVRWRLGGG